MVKRRIFYAHRIVLLNASNFFYGLFTGTGNETRQTQDGHYEINDIEYEVFEHLMRCIHTDTIQVPLRLAPGMLYAAHKFWLEDIEELCEAGLSCPSL